METSRVGCGNVSTINSFAGRHADYAFFMAHTDEPARCREALLRALSGCPPGAVRWLDFGCGGGEFLEGVLREWGRPAREIALHLVDPDTGAQERAVRRLTPLAASVARSEAIPDGGTFDVVASNHALYYPDDLARALRSLAAALAPGGVGIWTLGGRDNQLCHLWREFFGLVGQPLPFYLAEDVARWLRSSGLVWQEEAVRSVLRFPDSAENRDRIARFLFGPRLALFNQEAVREAFGAWRSGSEIVMENRDACFVVGGRASAEDGPQ